MRGAHHPSKKTLPQYTNQRSCSLKLRALKRVLRSVKRHNYIVFKLLQARATISAEVGTSVRHIGNYELPMELIFAFPPAQLLVRYQSL